MSDELPELKPARPDVVSDERKGYMPHLPWRWIAGVGLFLVLSIGTCRIRDQQETDALRATVLKAYESDLSPIAARYQDVATKIRTNTAGAAAQSAATTYIDPRLKFDALSSGKGLYLRINAEKAQAPLTNLEAEPDAITRCLGLAPLSVAELFAKGSFLEKDWIERAREADSVLRLRVVAEELRQRSQRDLPFVADASTADWFLLVLERGENRRDAPVDTYLWDLRANKLLMSTRAKASGGLVTARIQVGGSKPGHYGDGAQTGAAADCSIASQMRTLAGELPPNFTSTPPTPNAVFARDAATLATQPADAGT
ncbi:MAG TPA: hypothetical protein VI299_02630 [Polyangiales bacterium]